MGTRFFYFLTFTLSILSGLNACIPKNVTPSDRSFNYFADQSHSTQQFAIHTTSEHPIMNCGLNPNVTDLECVEIQESQIAAYL